MNLLNLAPDIPEEILFLNKRRELTDWDLRDLAPRLDGMRRSGLGKM